ncbi:MAG: hypothetical protein L6R19_24940 [Alphaproteobacteria bacterium]|nr:hypothetical protein [Alphaproteobacteria bacterium]
MIGERFHVAWRYLLVILLGNLGWEALHLPLYTVWSPGSPRYLAFVVAHCTTGDLLIGAASLALAWLVLARREWPHRRYRLVAMATIAGGVAYTLYSEWVNVYQWGRWGYSEAMPLVPPLGIGLSPILQWLIIPAAGFAWAQPAKRGRPALPSPARAP